MVEPFFLANSQRAVGMAPSNIGINFINRVEFEVAVKMRSFLWGLHVLDLHTVRLFIVPHFELERPLACIIASQNARVSYEVTLLQLQTDGLSHTYIHCKMEVSSRSAMSPSIFNAAFKPVGWTCVTLWYIYYM